MLPTELFHHILACLDCQDQDTLAACTLVCRDWLAISREHLFSELRILRGRDESFEDLADFLEQNPTVAGCVRILTLQARLISLLPQASLMPSLESDLLLRLLRVVPHIRDLRLSHLNILPPSSDSNTTSESHVYLEHMEYEGCWSDVTTPFTLLSHFRIEHLDFGPLFEAEEEQCAQIKLSNNCKLNVRSLCVDPRTAQPLVAFKVLKQTVPADMIQSFRYSAPSASMIPAGLPVADFLRSVGQNIVDLNLCPSAEDDHLLLPDLPSLKVLRYHLAAPLLTPAEQCEADRATLATFRDLWVPHLPVDLERLVLYIVHGAVREAGPATMPLLGLEPAFARFTRLQKLEVIYPHIPCAMDVVVKNTAACFPAAHAKGILDVSVIQWDLECRESDLYAYLRDDC
ncbi:hypothetical protein C8Q76DRAFT_767598 [Earliella scabrosa]|nr:hypothetical protein C8Q76DRAFT_767598 [Earliella scabrosa]